MKNAPATQNGRKECDIFREKRDTKSTVRKISAQLLLKQAAWGGGNRINHHDKKISKITQTGKGNRKIV